MNKSWCDLINHNSNDGPLSLAFSVSFFLSPYLSLLSSLLFSPLYTISISTSFSVYHTFAHTHTNTESTKPESIFRIPNFYWFSHHSSTKKKNTPTPNQKFKRWEKMNYSSVTWTPSTLQADIIMELQKHVTSYTTSGSPAWK